MVPELTSARISRSNCPIKLAPDHSSESTSEMLFGESVLVLEQQSRWFYVKTLHDGYEGFVETSACDISTDVATHWISAKASFIYAQPDIKSQVLQRLLFGSVLTLISNSSDDNFIELKDGGYVWAAHCSLVDVPLPVNRVELAQSHFLYAPYLWGGRSTDGCDCSGLVQMVMMTTGVNLPRDSGDQERFLSTDINFKDRAAGDLVFWPGHVGLLKSPDRLLHATAHSMRCCIEPLAEVIQRAGTPGSIKRIE